MYAGGANFGAVAEEESEAFDTGMNYRQPFVDWLRETSSTENSPLDLNGP